MSRKCGLSPSLFVMRRFDKGLVVTTTAYIKNDVPALTLEGTKKWWTRNMLERFAVAYLSLPVGEVKEIISRLADAVMETRQKIPSYIADHPDFKETGESMTDIWEEGVRNFKFLPGSLCVAFGNTDVKPRR